MRRWMIPFLLLSLIAPAAPLVGHQINSGFCQKPKKESGKEGALPSEGLNVAEQEREQRKAEAFLFLDEIAALAEKIEDKALGMLINLQVAELMWKLDEGPARQLFQRLMNEAEAISPSTSANPSDPKGLEAAQKQRWVIREILKVAAKHDAKLAQKLIEEMDWRSFSEDKVKRISSQASFYQDLLAEVWDLQRVEKRESGFDTDMLELVKRSLVPGGRIEQPLSLVFTAAARNPAVGDQVFRLIFSSYPRLAESQLSILSLLGFYLNSRFRQANLLVPLENEARAVLDLALTAAETLWRQALTGSLVSVDQPTRSFIMSLGNSYIPLFNKFEDPSRASLLANYYKILAGKLSTREQTTQRIAEVGSERKEGKTFEEQLEEINREGNPRARDVMLRNLALSSPSDQGQRAAEKITDLQMRLTTLEEVKIKRLQELIKEKRFEEARKGGDALNEPILRSRALIEVARAVEKDEIQFSDLLEKAYGHALKASPTPDRADCLFEIVDLYTRGDKARAFQIFAEAAKAVNEAKEERSIDLRDERFGGIIMAGGKLSLIHIVKFETIEVPKGIAALARENMDGTRAIAYGIRHPIVKCRALLLIASAFIEEIVKGNPPHKVVQVDAAVTAAICVRSQRVEGQRSIFTRRGEPLVHGILGGKLRSSVVTPNRKRDQESATTPTILWRNFSRLKS